MFHIKQIKSDDCGFSALKTLMANLFKNEEYLYIPQDEKLGPYSYKQLIDVAKEYGVTLEGVKAEGREVNQISTKPFLASLSIDDNRHLIYVHKVNKTSLEIFDPILGVLNMSMKEFISKWDNTCLVIEEVNEQGVVPLGKDMSLKEKVIISLFEIVSIAFVIGSLFFFNDENKLFISVILLSCSLIAEILLRVFLFNYLKKIDKKYVFDLETLPNNPYDHFVRLEEYKKALATTPVNFVISIVLFFFMATILILNSPYSAFTVLSVLFVLLVDLAFVNPSFQRRNQELSAVERKIDTSLTIDSFKEQFSLIREKSTRYAYNRLLIDLCRYLVIVLGIIIAMRMSKNYSILFVLINLAVSLMMLHQGTNIFNCPEKLEDLKIKRAKLINSKNDVKTS